MRARPLRVVAISLCAIVMASVIAAAGHKASATPSSNCEIIADWLAVHSSELPTTLEGLAAYPPLIERRIVGTFSPELKSALWREQLTRFLSSASLNNTQQAFVRRMIDFATAEQFRRASSFAYLAPADQEVHKKRQREVSEEARAIFDERQLEVFLHLGSIIDTPGRPAIPLPVLNPDDASPGSGPNASDVSSAYYFTCSCATFDDWCNNGSVCQNVVNCEKTGIGCGWFQIYPCNGLCVY